MLKSLLLIIVTTVSAFSPIALAETIDFDRLFLSHRREVVNSRHRDGTSGGLRISPGNIGPDSREYSIFISCELQYKPPINDKQKLSYRNVSIMRNITVHKDGSLSGIEGGSISNDSMSFDTSLRHETGYYDWLSVKYRAGADASGDQISLVFSRYNSDQTFSWVYNCEFGN